MNDYLLLLSVILFTCIGQLSQKKAACCWGKNAKVNTLLWLTLSVIFLSVGLLLWLKLLQHMPVSQAYPMLSVNFILVTLGSYFFFKEKVTRQHWLGMSMMMLGILLLGEWV